MNNFSTDIAEKYDLDITAVETLMGNMSYVKMPKNSHIVERDGFNDNFYLVRKGILRAYIPFDEGEQTLWFGYQCQAIMDVWCYHNRRPSPISIEAVTDCELYFISRDLLESLCDGSLAVCNMARKIFIGHATECEESFTSLFECDKGIERYMTVLKRHPELLQNVSLKKLASYIHLAPQSLSRIRAQLR